MPTFCITPHRVAAALAAAALLSACQGPTQRERPDPAFTPYIAAFTTGHVSNQATIRVRITEGQQWKDSSATALQGLFHLDPSVKGRVDRIDERTVAFIPDERLESDRTYTVRFRLGALIAVPERFAEFRFPITTFEQSVHMQVSDLRAMDQDDLTWQRLLVEVRTADHTDPEALQACFTVLQDGQARRLLWEHDSDGRQHRFLVDSLRRGEQASEVVLGWKGKAIGAEGEGSERFTVPPIGKLRLISARASSEGEQFAELLFSDPLDSRQDLAGLVGISGAGQVRTTVEGNRLVIYPGERLTGDQQAFVSAALRNVNGHRLDRDLLADLRFEELKPAVRLTGRGTILPSSTGLLLPF